MAEFDFGFSIRTQVLYMTGEPNNLNGAIINVINRSNVFPAMTSQNICCKKFHWVTFIDVLAINYVIHHIQHMPPIEASMNCCIGTLERLQEAKLPSSSGVLTQEG